MPCRHLCPTQSVFGDGVTICVCVPQGVFGDGHQICAQLSHERTDVMECRCREYSIATYIAACFIVGFLLALSDLLFGLKTTNHNSSERTERVNILKFNNHFFVKMTKYHFVLFVARIGWVV